jgi:hypothetical protein
MSKQMDKQQVIDRIDHFPLFEKKDVAVLDNGIWEKQSDKAICEVGKSRALCFVSPRYNLLQLADGVKPIVNGVGCDFSGSVIYFDGQAIVDIFPDSPIYQENSTKFGIVIGNSVNCTRGLTINFSVLHNGNIITIPKSIAGLKKTHANSRLRDYVNTYSGVVAKVRSEWKTIVEKFPQIKLDMAKLKGFLDDKELGITGDMRKSIIVRMVLAEHNNQDFTLWDFFNACIECVANSQYKSDFHRRKNTDGIVKRIIDYGFLAKFLP